MVHTNDSILNEIDILKKTIGSTKFTANDVSPKLIRFKRTKIVKSPN